MSTRRWMAHAGHLTPPWTAELRRELVAAYRRGSMDADRCLRTFEAQGEAAVFPPEAVAYLALRAAADRAGLDVPEVDAPALRDAGERALADLLTADPARFASTIEAGRRFFFPHRQPAR